MLKRLKVISFLLTFFIIFNNSFSHISYAASGKSVLAELFVPQLVLINLSEQEGVVELVWSNTVGEQNDILYEIYRDNTLVSKTENFTFTDDNLSQNTKYCYIVKAVDNHNNVILESNILNIMTSETLNNSYDLSNKVASGSSITVNTDNHNNTKYATNKFIIKYKSNVKVSDIAKVPYLMQDKISDIKYDYVYNIEIITLKNRMDIKVLEEYLQEEETYKDIDYIQPDYQYSFLIKNSYNDVLNLEEFSDGAPVNDKMVSYLSQYLKDFVNSNTELLELINTNSIQEIRYRLLTGNVEGDYDIVLSRELARELTLIDRNMKDASQINFNSEDNESITAEKTRSVIAILDSGMNITYMNLSDRIWSNSNEIANNGIDDDGNGKIDDINGWNFVEDNNNLKGTAKYLEYNPMSDISVNNIVFEDIYKEISNDNFSILPVIAFNNEKAYTSDIISAIQYAENMGADLFYCNFGDEMNNPILKEVIRNSKMQFICVISEDRNKSDKIFYPADFDCENIITLNDNINLSDFLRADNYNYTYEKNIQSADSSAIIQNTYKSELLSTTSSTGQYIQIDGYSYTNLALKSDGTVWAWGANDWGQKSSAIPMQIEGLSSITAIACGMSHCLALKSDGTVWAWGYNYEGELGDGTTISRITPAMVIGLQNVITIDAGEYHSLALKKDGTVWAWGENHSGQLGDGTTINRSTPVQVSNLKDIHFISAGGYHNLALASDSTVLGWGSNRSGEIGDGTNLNRTMPVRTGNIGVISIAAGCGFSLARNYEGEVLSWGANYNGQLGNGTTISSNVPSKIKDFSEVDKIQCGYYHGLAIKQDGSVWTWGSNDSGQLGDGTKINRLKPVQVSGMSKATGITGGESHSLALKYDGTVWEWGNNILGTLGNGKPAVPKELAKWSFGTPGITCTANSTVGNSINLVLKLNNVTSFTNLTFTVTYNINEVVQAIDLCKFTSHYDKELGLIKETYITIIENSPGIIKFSVNKPIPDGKSWSGIINIIEFESRINGKVNLTYSIE